MPTMDQVVCTQQAEDQLDALRSPLAVQPDPRELRGRE
jgi:hypothetical protein